MWPVDSFVTLIFRTLKHRIIEKIEVNVACIFIHHSLSSDFQRRIIKKETEVNVACLLICYSFFFELSIE